MITLSNIIEKLEAGGVVKRERLYHSERFKKYRLLNDVIVTMSNGNPLLIPEGFKWDLSSSPRFLWAIFPPDGDFEIAALIHDYLYQNQIYSRKFSDREMYAWSKVANKKNPVDNFLRYIAVRALGWLVWKKYI
jgi:DNA-binding Lrp family transcriptional regulator